jgi:hypothetical protein
VVRVLADLGDDDAARRLAHWLARRGQTGELQQRAYAGDKHAQQRLADR